MKIAKKDREKWQAEKIKQLEAEKKALNSQIRKLEKTNISATDADIQKAVEDAVKAEKSEKEKLHLEISQLKVQNTQLMQDMETNQKQYLKNECRYERSIREYKFKLDRCKNSLEIECSKRAKETRISLTAKIAKEKMTPLGEDDCKRLEGFNQGEIFFKIVGYDRCFFGSDLIIRINIKNGRFLLSEEIEYILHQIKDKWVYQNAIEEIEKYKDDCRTKHKAIDKGVINQMQYDLGMELLPLYKDIPLLY